LELEQSQEVASECESSKLAGGVGIETLYLTSLSEDKVISLSVKAPEVMAMGSAPTVLSIDDESRFLVSCDTSEFIKELF
jgi:hypothetical protein